MKRLVLTKETVRELGLAKANGPDYTTVFTAATCNLNQEVCMNIDEPYSVGIVCG